MRVLETISYAPTNMNSESYAKNKRHTLIWLKLKSYYYDVILKVVPRPIMKDLTHLAQELQGHRFRTVTISSFIKSLNTRRFCKGRTLARTLIVSIILSKSL